MLYTRTVVLAALSQLHAVLQAFAFMVFLYTAHAQAIPLDRGVGAWFYCACSCRLSCERE